MSELQLKTGYAVVYQKQKLKPSMVLKLAPTFRKLLWHISFHLIELVKLLDGSFNIIRHMQRLRKMSSKLLQIN